MRQAVRRRGRSGVAVADVTSDVPKTLTKDTRYALKRLAVQDQWLAPQRAQRLFDPSPLCSANLPDATHSPLRHVAEIRNCSLCSRVVARRLPTAPMAIRSKVVRTYEHMGCEGV